MSNFYAIITDDRSGEELARYTLADEDLLDCDLFANQYAQESGFSVDEADGHIPTGGADFTVTLTDQPGSVVCWSSQSYFIAHEEY